MDAASLVVALALVLVPACLFAALVGAVWMVWSVRKQTHLPGINVPGSAPTAGAVAPSKSSRADADLAAEVAELRHAFKLLSNEWADKEGRMDSLIKRVHRLLKVEQNGNGAEMETPVPAAPLTREAVLATYQARQQGRG